MALSTYAELQQQVITYAMRQGDADFAAAVPTFIRLTEEAVSANLRVGYMEKVGTLTLADGAASLPEDYLEMRSVVGLPTNGDLELLTPDQAIERYGNNPGGVPTGFAISGDRLSTFPSGSGDLTIRYYAAIPPLSDDNPTNWLLTRFPSVYLYGALTHSQPFMMEDQRVATWAQFFQSGIASIESQDETQRYSRAAGRIRGYLP